MIDDPSSEEAKELYAHFGLAFYCSSVLEHGVANAIFIFELIIYKSFPFLTCFDFASLVHPFRELICANAWSAEEPACTSPRQIISPYPSASHPEAAPHGNRQCCAPAPRRSRRLRQQRRGGGVDLNAYGVDAVLNHRIKGARKFVFAEIVLILADADRLGINLDQLGQRVLKPPRDRDRSAQGHVQPGQLLRGKSRSGVDRGPGLRDHHLGQLEIGMEPNELRTEPVGFARGGAVSDRDQFHPMLFGKPRQLSNRLVPTTLYGGMIESSITPAGSGPSPGQKCGC